MSSVMIFPKESDRIEPPAAEHLVSAAKALPSLGTPIVIDIEAWPVHAWGDTKPSDAERTDSVRKLTFVVRTLK